MKNLVCSNHEVLYRPLVKCFTLEDGRISEGIEVKNLIWDNIEPQPVTTIISKRLDYTGIIGSGHPIEVKRSNPSPTKLCEGVVVMCSCGETAVIAIHEGKRDDITRTAYIDGKKSVRYEISNMIFAVVQIVSGSGVQLIRIPPPAFFKFPIKEIPLKKSIYANPGIDPVRRNEILYDNEPFRGRWYGIDDVFDGMIEGGRLLWDGTNLKLERTV